MRTHVAVLSAVLLMLPVGASAQDRSDPISPQAFQPALGPSNWLTVETARIEGGSSLPWSAGLLMTYERNPFDVSPARCRVPLVDDRCPGDDFTLGEPIAVVRNQIVWHMMGTVSLIKRLQLGLDLPLVWLNGNRVEQTGATVERTPHSTFGLSDPRLHGKFRFWGRPQGLALAGSLAITVPFAGIVGQENDYVGNDIPMFVPKAILEWRRGKIGLGFNVGANVRYETSRQYSSDVGTSILYGFAGSYDVGRRYRVIGEIFGSSVPPFEVDVSPVEADVAFQAQLGHFALTAGVGAGLTEAIGAPTFRGILGVLYFPTTAADRDGDDVEDSKDLCKDDPEDVDGFVDDDGCPEADNDVDGKDDGSDRCPNEPEDVDEFQDTDGCPDSDNDGDGIADGYDSCANVAEDKDGDRDEDGCPDQDQDGDGVNDINDRCVNEAEDTDGFSDEDGCPETDNDDDGVPDERDECPEQAEDRDGRQDADGCPEEDRRGGGGGGGGARRQQ